MSLTPQLLFYPFLAISVFLHAAQVKVLTRPLRGLVVETVAELGGGLVRDGRFFDLGSLVAGVVAWFSTAKQATTAPQETNLTSARVAGASPISFTVEIFP